MASSQAASSSTVVFITRNGMGTAEPELQLKLLRTYLTLLEEGGTLPGAICFYTDGVKLVAEGSPLLDILARIEAKGVHLISCLTCLHYFGLADTVRVGVIGGMPDIIEAQQRATKVVSI